MKRPAWLILPIMLLGACGGGVTPVASGVRTVSAVDVAGVIESAPSGLVVLDVRTPDEFGQGHLAGAVNLDFYDAGFGDLLAELDRDVPYVLYCRSGNRSSSVARMMDDMGFAEVYELDGGIVSWAAADLPLVTS